MDGCGIFEIDSERVEMRFSTINLFIFSLASFVPVECAFCFAHKGQLVSIFHFNRPIGVVIAKRCGDLKPAGEFTEDRLSLISC
jgi:hypothetical protein